MSSPINYKRYLYGNFNKICNIVDYKILDDLTLITMNDDTIIFNKLLESACYNNRIKYFDLINERVVVNDKIIELKKEFIGDDHYYNGCHSIKILNEKIYNNHINDYIVHLLFKNTYNVFFSKLINIIEQYFF
jgi:hypothetical protein